MLKKCLGVIFVIALFSLSACGNSGEGETPVSHYQTNASVQMLQDEIMELSKANEELLIDNQSLLYENQILQAEIQQLMTKETFVDGFISGAFVAEVRHIMPDYVFDGQPRIAILQEFQTAPFLMNMDLEVIAQLEIGQIYFFEIEDTFITDVPVHIIERAFGNYSNWIYRRIDIRSVRLAADDEIALGHNAPQVRFSIVAE